MSLLTPHVKTQSDLLTRKQTAEYLGVTSRTLAVWACTKRYNLPFVKMGRLVKYRIADLDAFITRRTVSTTQIEE
jgi:excisionase family DNA binding protein